MDTATSTSPATVGEQIPRLRSSLPAADPDTFFEAVRQALDLHMKSESVPAGAEPFYLHQFPKERVSTVDKPFDGITFSVVSSVPAATRNDGTISRRPFYFDDQAQTLAGYTKKTATWFELVTVEFVIWSKSNPTRGKLVNWFHRFMRRYAEFKFFEARGVDKFQFVGRGQDGFETHEDQEIYYGTLTYQCRVQFMDTYLERKLDKLSVSLQLGSDQQTILQTA